MTIKSVLITGANAGLGKESARLMALRPETERVLLACRNPERAEAAKAELEQATGRKIFEIVLMDVTDIAGVRKVVDGLTEPIDGLIMNAGGAGGAGAGDMTPEGVRWLFSVNVLGHAALLEALLEQGKLTQAAIFASSEAARGIPAMGFARPDLPESSVDDFLDVAKGSARAFDPMKDYGPVKYVGTLWMSAMARKHPNIRFVSVSPGMTTGTNAAEEAPGIQKVIFKYIAFPVMTWLGRAHGVETGAQRYVDVLVDDKYTSGRFYASPWPSTSGPLVDQAEIFADLDNKAFQDNASTAVASFL